MAFYGRLWKDDGTLLGIGVPDRLVDTLIRRYNGKVEVDRTSGSAVGTFTIGPADTGMTISGHRLTPGNYTVWFENESTLKTRLALADRYNLLGTGSWSLNQESAGTWDYYSLWLNGAAFGDAEGHWAQNEIASTVHKGWLNGMEPGLFSPDGPLTRAQAAAVLRRVGNGLSPRQTPPLCSAMCRRIIGPARTSCGRTRKVSSTEPLRACTSRKLPHTRTAGRHAGPLVLPPVEGDRFLLGRVPGTLVRELHCRRSGERPGERLRGRDLPSGGASYPRPDGGRS
ncbi:S-layer homology domain-containing protein [Paenibacillus sp. CC-CFT747]|nr:S-layer homology domain-containing protein [Paenibacillus sp. CC-CFT747]